jgi:hypothetical protein
MQSSECSLRVPAETSSPTTIVFSGRILRRGNPGFDDRSGPVCGICGAHSGRYFGFPCTIPIPATDPSHCTVSMEEHR